MSGINDSPGSKPHKCPEVLVNHLETEVEVELWPHSFHYFLGSGQRKVLGCWGRDVKVELWLHSFYYFLGSGQRKQEMHECCNLVDQWLLMSDVDEHVSDVYLTGPKDLGKFVTILPTTVVTYYVTILTYSSCRCVEHWALSNRTQFLPPQVCASMMKFCL